MAHIPYYSSLNKAYCLLVTGRQSRTKSERKNNRLEMDYKV